MRYIYFCVLAILSIGLVSSCMVEEESVGSVDGQLVHKVFDATFEDSDMTTKTVLDETVGENGFRGLLWDSGDEIGVSRYDGYYQKFTNVLGEPSANGVFEGYIDQTSQYYAIYPYTDNQRHGTSVSVTIPTVQTYRVNSFDRNMAPMVGKGNDGERLHFMNLCGVLAVQLTGSETIKSIVFQTKNGEKVSGICSVDPDYADYPVLDTSTATETYVTLDCGEGVQLSGEATPFHIVLPPGTYNGFTLYITTADGKFMEKTTDKTLTIKRSIVTKAASFAFENNVTEVTNLSERGHSNCYIVPGAGIYSFDAGIIGNGEFGIIEGAGFHTSDVKISPNSAELIWQDKSCQIKGYVYIPDSKKVVIWVGPGKGNALFAVKDNKGVILWSWHIWMTDTPVEQTYINNTGTYVMLDRNIGATLSTRGIGDDWKSSRGLVYFWGRKDPFLQDAYILENGFLSLEQSISHPNIKHSTSSWTHGSTSWMGNYKYQNNLWDDTNKTIYDPCPVGYRVANSQAFIGFTTSSISSQDPTEFLIDGIFDYGWNFYVDDSKSETAWYPVVCSMDSYNSYCTSSTEGMVWTSDKTSNTDKFLFKYSETVVEWRYERDGYGYPVRCMKDVNYEATKLPIVKHNDESEYTTNSVTFGGNVTYSGWGDISDCGFIYSVNSDMSDSQSVSCGSGLGEFSYVLEGLTSGSVYFVKAYATNSYGTSYSDVRRYRTKYSDVDNNLSSEWVANCYIVDPSPASYCFDVTTVGNGNIGYVAGENFYPQNPWINPSSAEILWEDTPGVISDIMLQNGMVNFMTNDLEGNAVIAVKDASGVILWSWHIWVTDQPAEHTYVTNEGKTFVVMDRYLGSINAEIAQNGGALYYQWGRKDPFRFNGSHLEASFRGQFADLSESISAPTYYPQGDDWVTDISTSLWSKDMKTIYDPCPEGWRVPSSEIWYGIRKLQDLDSNGYGVVFGFSDTDSFWYPDAPRFTNNGDIDGSYTCDRTEVWTSEYGVSYHLKYNGTNANYRARCDAYPVRCMKDE